MVLQEKEGSRWEARQRQISPVQPWSYAAIGGELLGDLLPSCQLEACQIHDYPKHYHIASHQASRFCSGLHSGWCKNRDIHGTTHRFWSWRVPPQIVFSPSEDKIYGLYSSLQAYFKIKYDGDINKYLGIDLYLRPYISIHSRQPYLTQIILNMIPVMYKSSSKPTPAVKFPLKKIRDIKQEKMTLITDQ